MQSAKWTPVFTLHSSLCTVAKAHPVTPSPGHLVTLSPRHPLNLLPLRTTCRLPWVQNYNPWGAEWLSTLVAAIPIVLLLGSLVAGSSAPRAAWRGLAAALLIAIFVYEMPPKSALSAAGFGACFGLLPIGWIVLNAVFLYHLTVRSGQFEIVKRSVAAISPDRRMQALLIAFSFGTFLEGAAGFGTPVAISAALLIGLGFSPLYAAGLALIANTSPVAFGALGTPIITLAERLRVQGPRACCSRRWPAASCRSSR